MKRTAGILAVLTVPVLLLAGCSSNSSNTASNSDAGNGKVVDITVWHGYAAGQGKEQFDKMVQAFNASHPDIHVTDQFITNVDQLLPKVQTALVGDQEPDVLADGGPTWGANLWQSGKLVDLTPYLQSSQTLKQSDFYPGTLEASTYQGHILGIPNDGGTIGVFYNKDLFKKAGLNPDQPPQTWTELAQDANQITQKAGAYGYDVPIGNQEWTVWMWEGLLWANGGDLIDTSGAKAKPVFNSPAGVKSLQTWIDMIHKSKSAMPTAIPSGTALASVLEKGNLGMILDGPWDITPLKQANFNFGTFAFPKGDAGQATLLGTDVFYMFKTGDAKQKASWEFIQWMMDPNRLAQWDVDMGFVPTLKAAADTQTYKDFLAKNPDLKPMVDGLQYAHARPDLKSYDQISAELGKYIEKALYGQMPAKAALDAAVQQAQQILTSNNE